MKVWILAGIFSAATVPFAAAAENTVECQLDDARRIVEQRSETPPPAPTPGQPAVAQRGDGDEATPRPSADRRRSGKRIPDAELIGPRGAL